MRKLVAMFSIISMLCGVIGTTNYEVAKAANVIEDTVDNVSGAAIKQEEQSTAETAEKVVLDDDDDEDNTKKEQIGDFIIAKKYYYSITVNDNGYEINYEKPIWWIDEYLGNSSNVTIPDEYQGEKIEGIDSCVFQDHAELEEIKLPKSLRIIGEEAFSGCTNLKKIEIPETVETICEYAFCKCTNLKKIHLPKALKVILDYVFMDAGVEEFTIDSSNAAFTTIDGVLYNKKCTQLVLVPNKKTKVQIPDTITQINQNAARGNKELKEVKFSSALKIIKDYAFEGCSALKEVKFPNTLKTIGTSAFDGCSTLKKVIFPNALKTIGYAAFKECSVLKEVKFPNTLKTIYEEAFKGCSALKDIYIPASVTILGNNAFTECSNIKTFKINNKNKKYSASDGDFYNKNKTIFYASVTNKESVTIPKSVKEIETDTFGENVKKIKVEKGNKNFSEYDGALYNKNKTILQYCPVKKTSIILPVTFKEDSYSQLEGDNKLEKIQIKAGSKKFSSYKGILYDKKKKKMVYIPRAIKSVIIPSTCTSGIALQYYECVTSIVVEKGNKKYQAKDGILYDKNLTKVIFCTKNKKKIVLPKTVKKIGSNAFYKCTKLKNITLSEKLEEVECYAFENCRSLEYVKFPEQKIQIGTLAFMNCSKLKWVYVPKKAKFSEKRIDNIFGGSNKLKDIYYSGNEEDWEKSWYQTYEVSDEDDDGNDYKDTYCEMDWTVFERLTIHYEADAPL